MVPVILDTDMAYDVDDVGALACLHALADRREAKILGVVYNETHPLGPIAIDVINRWYGRQVPIGAFKGFLKDPDESRYLKALSEFPHSIEGDVPNAFEIYRTILENASLKEVTIVSIGFLNNLHQLLQREPDLVKQKVSRLIVMGGLLNDAFNLFRHDFVGISAHVIQNWPTELVVSDCGVDVYTGAALESASKANPVREAYRSWFGGKFQGRSSWDQIAVIYAVRGAASGLVTISSGKGSLANGFEWNLSSDRMYVQSELEPREAAHVIDSLMTQLPANKT